MLHPLIRAAGIVCLCGAALAARADDASEINRLFTTGQTAAALARIDALLAAKPRDAQLRFLKGVMLADLKRADEAAAIFSQLIVDYPEMPEAYNNLAVIQAARGDYDKARASLEAAVRANPSYAVARHNLADIHVELARLDYQQALRLDPNNTAIGPKLALLRQVVTPIKAAP